MKSLSSYAFFWDTEKALLNERKHGVSFEEAATVFEDSLAVYFPNPTDDSGEERWIVIGLTNKRTLVVVVHLYSDGNGGALVRIISARKATSHERRVHETSPYSIREPSPMTELKPETPFDMEDEYEIPPNAERGKFYSPSATRVWPIYLDPDVLKHFSEIAWSRGIETKVLLNEILRHQMTVGGECK